MESLPPPQRADALPIDISPPYEMTGEMLDQLWTAVLSDSPAPVHLTMLESEVHREADPDKKGALAKKYTDGMTAYRDQQVHELNEYAGLSRLRPELLATEPQVLFDAARGYIRFDRRARDITTVLVSINALLEVSVKKAIPLTTELISNEQIGFNRLQSALRVNSGVDANGVPDGTQIWAILRDISYAARPQQTAEALVAVGNELDKLLESNTARKARFLERFKDGERLSTANAVNEQLDYRMMPKQ